jgi:hypothetical protein
MVLDRVHPIEQCDRAAVLRRRVGTRAAGRRVHREAFTEACTPSIRSRVGLAALAQDGEGHEADDSHATVEAVKDHRWLLSVEPRCSSESAIAAHSEALYQRFLSDFNVYGRTKPSA